MFFRKCLSFGLVFAFVLCENLRSKPLSFPSSNLKCHSAERDMNNVTAGAMLLLFFPVFITRIKRHRVKSLKNMGLPYPHSQTYQCHILSSLNNGPLGKREQIFFFFFSVHAACGILVPWPGIEPRISALKVWHPNHWNGRELLEIIFYIPLNPQKVVHCLAHRTSSKNDTCCQEIFLFPFPSLSRSRDLCSPPQGRDTARWGTHNHQ